MALTAFWLRFAPRQFARGRDYEVSCALELEPSAATAFTVLAEGALRAGTGAEAVWQFVALTAAGPVVLARCDFETRDGARARVIWALALPLEYLQSSGFALYALSERFAALQDSGALPASFELEPQRAKPPMPETTTLLAKYIEAGTARVSAPAAQALKLFCQTLELLPPGDRLRVSFSTAAAQGRTLEVDASAATPELLTVGEEARAIANLWCILRYGVAPVEHELSLTRNPVDWICGMLATDEVAARFRGLAKLVTERLDAAQHATAFALLRRALEVHLMRIPAKPAALALAQLEAEGYLGPEYGTPPIWITRLALELRLLAHLPPALLQKVLRPGALTFLLGALQQPSSSARLESWVAALQQPTALDPTVRRELLAACGVAWRDLLSRDLVSREVSRGSVKREPVRREPGARRRAFGHGDLARSVALLALYEHCRGVTPAKSSGAAR